MLRKGARPQPSAVCHSVCTSWSSSATDRAIASSVARQTRRESAQTAAPRTSGDGSPRSARQCGARLASPELPAAISTLRMKRSRPMRLTGEPEKNARNAAIVQLEKLGERRRFEIGARLQLLLARRDGELVPWADGETVVAAIDAVADRVAEVVRDRSRVLDREVGDAAARVELVGRGKGVGRAGVEAGAARAAMVRFRRVRRQFRGGEDRAEEEPRAEVAADEVGVLALPAEAGLFRERLLHHRRGVDEDLDVGAGSRGEPGRDLLQPALDDVVIVAVARIDGDRGAVRAAKAAPGGRFPARSSSPA